MEENDDNKMHSLLVIIVSKLNYRFLREAMLCWTDRGVQWKVGGRVVWSQWPKFRAPFLGLARTLAPLLSQRPSKEGWASVIRLAISLRHTQSDIKNHVSHRRGGKDRVLKKRAVKQKKESGKREREQSVRGVREKMLKNEVSGAKWLKSKSLISSQSERWSDRHSGHLTRLTHHLCKFRAGKDWQHLNPDPAVHTESAAWNDVWKGCQFRCAMTYTIWCWTNMVWTLGLRNGVYNP